MRGVLGLRSGRLSQMMVGAKPRLLQQRQQRRVGRAVLGIGKGQVALLAALGVGNAGKMRVELHRTLIPQPAPASVSSRAA